MRWGPRLIGLQHGVFWGELIFRISVSYASSVSRIETVDRLHSRNKTSVERVCDICVTDCVFSVLEPELFQLPAQGLNQQTAYRLIVAHLRISYCLSDHIACIRATCDDAIEDIASR